jgi:hypothetical protein
MALAPNEIALFYKLWYGLVWGVNEKHKIIPRFRKPVFGRTVDVDLATFMRVRDAIWDRPERIDRFLARQKEFDQTESAIIADWRSSFVKGRFLVVKHLTRYSALMPFESGTDSDLVYGVHGISDPLSLPLPQTPCLAELVLLPFQGKIIYDSFVGVVPVSFGPGIRASAKQWYAEARAKNGIIKTLETAHAGR